MNLKSSLGIWLAGFFFFIILIGPWLALMDPNYVDLSNRLQSPGIEHWFGTDQLGRDVFSRILNGGQTTVGISMLALFLSILIGVPFGLFSGYWGGRTDWALMRIVDSFMALPDYVVAIIISGLLGPGFFNLLLAIVIVKWVVYTRLARSIVFQEKSKDYLMVSKVSGASTWQILTRHLIPHVLGPILALATLDIGKVILLVASLSFIGLGVRPPSSEWGAMLNEGKAYFMQAEYLMIIPGVAIFLVVLVANWLGNQLVAKYDLSQTREETNDEASQC
ncbi:MAG: ABC transporter permease subunit [Negativicutes bacterium]|nr:ABC transporter permease subunit [Negativicutes bacterium]